MSPFSSSAISEATGVSPFAAALQQLEVMERAAVPEDWTESPSRSIRALMENHVVHARTWNPADLCDFRIRLALVCLRWNQFGKAQWFTLAALDTLRLLDDPSSREKTGMTLAQLGRQWRKRHGLYHAHRCLSAAVELQERSFNKEATSDTLEELGMVLLSMGHPAEATAADGSGQRCG